MTAELSFARNCFVAALAGYISIAHAAPCGKAEHFCGEVPGEGMPVMTF
jgi:hypothetical protein